MVLDFNINTGQLYLVYKCCALITLLLQNGPGYLCIIYIHLTSIGLKIHCNEAKTHISNVPQNYIQLHSQLWVLQTYLYWSSPSHSLQEDNHGLQ